MSIVDQKRPRNGSQTHRDKDEVKRLTAGSEGNTLVTVTGIDRSYLDGKHHPCPKCGGKDRFRYFGDGGSICSQCCPQGNADILATAQWMLECSFPEAVNLVGEHVGANESQPVKKEASASVSVNGSGAKTQEESPKESQPEESGSSAPSFERWRLQFKGDGKDQYQESLSEFCRHESRRGITPESLIAMRTRRSSHAFGSEPYIIKGEDGAEQQANPPCIITGIQPVLAIPIFNGSLRDIVGYSMYREDGRKWGEEDGKEKSSLMLRGSKNGWQVARRKVEGRFLTARSTLDSCKKIIITEGQSDCLALASIAPDGWAILTASCGAQGRAKLGLDFLEGTSKDIHIVLDSDDAGRNGAYKLANRLASDFEGRVRLIDFNGEEKYDTRSFINDGGTFGEIIEKAVDYDPAIHKIAEDPATEERVTEGIVQNYYVEFVEGKDGGLKPVEKPLRIDEIVERVLNLSQSPKRVGTQLFTIHRGEAHWLGTSSALFGFIGTQTILPPSFKGGRDYHTKDEVFTRLQVEAESFDSIEKLPHFPPIEGRYYLMDGIEPGDGEHLRELVSRFSPATTIDRDLIEALFVTPGCGLPPGSRPAFLITSDAGRGSGKTTLAKMVELLWGGKVDVTAREPIDTLKQRLLSPEALSKRIAILDNLKSNRFSNADFEGLITSTTINGKRLYHGDASRPNDLTWIITGNGLSLSTDIAQRAVFIEIEKPKYSGDWESRLVDFITEKQIEILSDIAAFFQRERFPLDRYSRWAKWEREVLERLPEPSEAQAVVRERQQVSDVENEETEEIRHAILERFAEVAEIDVQKDKIFISSKLMREIVSSVTGDRGLSVIACSRNIRQKIDAGEIAELSHGRVGSKSKRGFFWTGEDYSGEGVVDGETAIAHQEEKDRFFRS